MPDLSLNPSQPRATRSSPSDPPPGDASPCPSPCLTENRPSGRPSLPADAADHPKAHARLRRAPEYRTGLEICRADLTEAGDCPPTGPWSPCSAAAGLTEAYLDHLARTEPGLDPAAEAERAYVVEQFALAHALGRCRYAGLREPVASPYPGRPYVGAYLDLSPSHGERDGPAGGLLLVAAPDGTGGFLDRYRALNRAEAHWWARGDGPEALLAPGLLTAARRRAVAALLDRLAVLRT